LVKISNRFDFRPGLWGFIGLNRGGRNSSERVSCTIRNFVGSGASSVFAAVATFLTPGPDWWCVFHSLVPHLADWFMMDDHSAPRTNLALLTEGFEKAKAKFLPSHLH
jgi:hypothetical protein